jgi:hypothetical protein
VPPIVESGEQSIEQFNADPSSASGASQTPTLQFENADGSAASSTTFELSATGAAQSSNSSIFDAYGVLMADVQSTYAASGLAGNQDVAFFDAVGSIAGAYAATNLADGSSITVQSLFNTDGLVGSQDVTLYRPDGSISSSVMTTDTEAADRSLMTTEGTVTDGNANPVNTFSLTNAESADGSLGGVVTVLSTGATIANTAGTLRFQVQGPSLKLFLNGKLISHAHDSVLKTGSTGMVASQGASEKMFHTGAIVAPP